MLANKQRFEFSMSISNQALTAQVPVNAARASMRLQPGCYTMIETPVVGMLPGDREAPPIPSKRQSVIIRQVLTNNMA